MTVQIGKETWLDIVAKAREKVMPYGNDEWLEDVKRHRDDLRIKANEYFEKKLLERLRETFDIPAEFERLAVQIWLNGKED